MPLRRCGICQVKSCPFDGAENGHLALASACICQVSVSNVFPLGCLLLGCARFLPLHLRRPDSSARSLIEN